MTVGETAHVKAAATADAAAEVARAATVTARKHRVKPEKPAMAVAVGPVPTLQRRLRRSMPMTATTAAKRAVASALNVVRAVAKQAKAAAAPAAIAQSARHELKAHHLPLTTPQLPTPVQRQPSPIRSRKPMFWKPCQAPKAARPAAAAVAVAATGATRAPTVPLSRNPRLCPTPQTAHMTTQHPARRR